METKFEFKSILWQARKRRKERTPVPPDSSPAGWVLPQPAYI